MHILAHAEWNELCQCKWVLRSRAMTINFGRSSVLCHGEKSIVNSPRPQDFYASIKNFIREPYTYSSMPSQNVLHQPALKYKWTTTTREATNESALPTSPQPAAPSSTFQTTANPLAFPKCYDKLPTLQHAAWVPWKTWDSSQTRAPIPKNNLVL